MLNLETQLQIPRIIPSQFTVVRSQLRRGRTYKDAVKKFEPYRESQDVDPSTRDALRRIAERPRRLGEPAFLFVNNRLLGNVPSTIEAVVSTLAV
jgi:hypothetical protein